MGYESQYEVMKDKLLQDTIQRLDDRLKRNVKDLGPHTSEGDIPDLLRYRAEKETWCQTFGEEYLFPGIEPEQSVQQPESQTISTREMQAILETEMSTVSYHVEKGKRKPKVYEPMFGWNPASGEPWLVINLKARNAYPSLTGRENSKLKAFQEMIPSRRFVIQFLRRSNGVMIWPEFCHRRDYDVNNRGYWYELEDLRGFLFEWSMKVNPANEVEDIHLAYEKYLGSPQSSRKPLCLPPKFPTHPAPGRQQDSSSASVSSKSQNKQRRSRSSRPSFQGNSEHNNSPQDMRAKNDHTGQACDRSSHGQNNGWRTSRVSFGEHGRHQSYARNDSIDRDHRRDRSDRSYSTTQSGRDSGYRGRSPPLRNDRDTSYQPCDLKRDRDTEDNGHEREYKRSR